MDHPSTDDATTTVLSQLSITEGVQNVIAQMRSHLRSKMYWSAALEDQGLSEEGRQRARAKVRDHERMLVHWRDTLVGFGASGDGAMDLQQAIRAEVARERREQGLAVPAGLG